MNTRTPMPPALVLIAGLAACAQTNVGAKQLVPYTADYIFYRAL